MSTFPEPWHSSTSYWQATNRGRSSLWGWNKTAPLPTAADVVIIGAGTMGSSLSYFLTREDAYGAGKKVVCVEAKDCGSGASGRNGGHVGPKTYYKWDLLMKPFPIGIGCTEEEATIVMQSERDNLDLVAELVEKHKLDVDFWRGELCEAHYSKEQTEWSKERNAAWQASRARLGLEPNPETAFIDDPVKAQAMSRMKGVTSIHTRPAGSIHSHKICSALMRLAIESTASDFSFYSHAPVSGFPEKMPDGKWIVETARGKITASRVILCTNAYTRNFFPEGSLLHDHISPVRAHCAAINPTRGASGLNALSYTYNLKDETYMVQTGAGPIILGGGVSALMRQGLMTDADLFGQIDDSVINPACTDYLADFLKTNLVGWGEEGHGEGLAHIWSGILSSVKDWLPLIGDVPGVEGVSMCAGFAGHGMSRIFACARGYADTLKTGKWDEALLPKLFELTQERLEKTARAEAELNAGGMGHDAIRSLLHDARASPSHVDDALAIMKGADGDAGVGQLEAIASELSLAPAPIAIKA